MKLLTTGEAAKILGVSARRVRAMIADNKMPALRIGRDYAIEERSLASVKVYGKAGRPSKSGMMSKSNKSRKKRK